MAVTYVDERIGSTAALHVPRTRLLGGSSSGRKFRVGGTCGTAVSLAFAGVSKPNAQSGSRSNWMVGAFVSPAEGIADSGGGTNARRS